MARCEDRLVFLTAASFAIVLATGEYRWCKEQRAESCDVVQFHCLFWFPLRGASVLAQGLNQTRESLAVISEQLRVINTNATAHETLPDG